MTGEQVQVPALCKDKEEDEGPDPSAATVTRDLQWQHDVSGQLRQIKDRQTNSSAFDPVWCIVAVAFEVEL